jgi:virginiamycin A acetyltransferase
VLLGSHVSVINGGGQHGIERLDIPIREQPGSYPRVTIGRDTWIGDRSIVLADVGQHCVVGAGSVVIKPVPDYAIAVGNPARVIRFRNNWLDPHADPVQRRTAPSQFDGQLQDGDRRNTGAARSEREPGQVSSPN